MAMIGKIRRMHYRDGLSTSAIVNSKRPVLPSRLRRSSRSSHLAPPIAEPGQPPDTVDDQGSAQMLALSADDTARSRN
jgi:hypothetical protein